MAYIRIRHGYAIKKYHCYLYKGCYDVVQRWFFMASCCGAPKNGISVTSGLHKSGVRTSPLNSTAKKSMVKYTTQKYSYYFYKIGTAPPVVFWLNWLNQQVFWNLFVFCCCGKHLSVKIATFQDFGNLGIAWWIWRSIVDCLMNRNRFRSLDGYWYQDPKHTDLSR